MRMKKQFIEKEHTPSMDQEDVRETQQPWQKRTKEEVDSSSSKLGHDEWSYDPELERLMEECEGKIASSVSLLMYMMQKYGDTSLITSRQIGDEGDVPTSHPPSPSNQTMVDWLNFPVGGSEANGIPRRGALVKFVENVVG